MSIADNLSSEETKLMAEMQAQEPEEKMLIREEKVGPKEEPEIELRQEVKDLIKEPEAPKVEETKVEEKPKEEAKRLVPLSELQEERRSRKEAQDAARIAQERMDMLLQRLAPQEPVKQPVDLEKDPLGKLKEIDNELAQLRHFRQQQEQFAQQTNYYNQIKESAKNQEAEYIRENPDYAEAGTFLMNQRLGQLKAMGYDDLTAKRHMAQESLNLAELALKNGQSVPQVIHNLAKSSGFTPKTTSDPVDDKLDNVARGMKANVSLSNANGAAPKSATLTGASIAKMSEKEFNAFYEKLSSSDKRAVLGQ